MEMQMVNIALIKVTEGRRINEKNVNRIMESVVKMGLMSPIFITKDFVLVAGGHRLEAFKRLHAIAEDVTRVIGAVSEFVSYESIPAIITEETDEQKLKIMEITENMARNEKFTPVEMCKMAWEARESWKIQGLFNDGHRQKAEAGKLRNEDLANLTKVSKSTIKNYLRIWENLAEEIREYVMDNREDFSMQDLVELTKIDKSEQAEKVSTFKAEKKAASDAAKVKEESERVNGVNEQLGKDGRIVELEEEVAKLKHELDRVKSELRNAKSGGGKIDKKKIAKLIHPDIFNGALSEHPNLKKNLEEALQYVNSL